MKTFAMSSGITLGPRLKHYYRYFDVGVMSEYFFLTFLKNMLMLI